MIDFIDIIAHIVITIVGTITLWCLFTLLVTYRQMRSLMQTLGRSQSVKLRRWLQVEQVAALCLPCM